MRPSRRFCAAQLRSRCSISSIHTGNLSPYFGNLEFDIFDAGGLHCQFIMSVIITVNSNASSTLT